MLLAVYNDRPSSEPLAAAFEKQHVLARLRALDSRARRKGLGALDPSKNPLIAIGTETDGSGRVTKNSYGVFNLSWQAEAHPEWPGQVEQEIAEIRKRIRATHRTALRFLIWAGMGGSAEDKSMYNAVGLLSHGPRCYVLDSTDPAKLKHILEDMERRSGLTLAQALRATLVVGMAMGMTSYEPVVNLEKLALLYDRHKIDSRPNFLYMTLPGSLLDRFGAQRGYRKVELQLDNANSTAGRHSSPLTRGSLYPLALAGNDIAAWVRGTCLSGDEITAAWGLAAFIQAQSKAGRDKLTLILPKAWSGAALWTKQDFEESLGKREDIGLKVVIGEKTKLANYSAPKDPAQDRLFVAVQIKGQPGADAAKIALLRRAGYPLATLTLPAGTLLSRYMQMIHYAVFGVAWQRRMNFVTQPSVELYKAITNRLHGEAQKAGGIEMTREWQSMANSPRRIRWRGAVTLHYDRLADVPASLGTDAPAVYAGLIKACAARRQVEYSELTFFGDTRYSPRGRAVRQSLDRAAELLFRARLKMPVDVYEGPAMNHSYHEMVIGHGKCFSTVLLSERAERLAAADYGPDYHRAQFLATQMALAERGRAVVAITLRDLSEATIEALDEFFRQAAGWLKAGRI